MSTNNSREGERTETGGNRNYRKKTMRKAHLLSKKCDRFGPEGFCMKMGASGERRRTFLELKEKKTEAEVK